MHLFNCSEQLKKYDNAIDIIKCYYDKRLEMYNVRKNMQLDILLKEKCKLNNKVKYIIETLNGTIDLRGMKKPDVISMLESKKYDKLEDDDEYKYLVKMPMDSVTEENVKKMQLDEKNKESEYDELNKTSIQQLWLNELDILQDKLSDFYDIKKKDKEKTKVSKSDKKVKKINIAFN